jgi:hypothetical protein
MELESSMERKKKMEEDVSRILRIPHSCFGLCYGRGCINKGGVQDKWSNH